MKSIIKISAMFIMLFFNFIACSSPTDSDKHNTLYVKFLNEPASDYTITTIQLQAMGKADDTGVTPSGIWSANILTDGKTIAPGAHEFFTLDIPNLHWSQYRLGVSDGNGGEIMLHEQEGYEDEILWTPSITHWGSDERSASVTIVSNPYTGVIYISGYSDFAGIDE
jgi:hypothetical protein